MLHFILVRLFLHLCVQPFSHGRQRDSKPHSGEKTVGPGNSWKSVLYCDPFFNSYTHSSYPSCRTRPHFRINIKLNPSNSLLTTLNTQRKFLYYNAQHFESQKPLSQISFLVRLDSHCKILFHSLFQSQTILLL